MLICIACCINLEKLARGRQTVGHYKSLTIMVIKDSHMTVLH